MHLAFDGCVVPAQTVIRRSEIAVVRNVGVATPNLGEDFHSESPRGAESLHRVYPPRPRQEATRLADLDKHGCTGALYVNCLQMVK